MSGPRTIRFDDGHAARSIEVGHAGELAQALEAVGLADARPVLVLVGGASNIDARVAARLEVIFESLARGIDRTAAAVLDGGTAHGVMALMGLARCRTGARFPLVGIAARGTVALPGDHPGGRPERAHLDRNHSHFLLVPGDRWGEESRWISDAAGCIATGCPSLTLVAAGGEVTREDLTQSLRAARPVLALAGSGGTADRFARWRRGGSGTSGLEPLDADPTLVEVLDMADAARELPGLVTRMLGG